MRIASNARNSFARSVTVIMVSVLCTLGVCHNATVQAEPAIGQHSYTFEGDNQRLNYLLFLPSGYTEKPDVEWPLILFFHGMGKNDGTVDSVRSNGLPGKVEADQDFPFIVVSPHFPTAIANPILDIIQVLKDDEKVNMDLISTTMETVIALLDDVISTYRVDKSRIYATGQSQGGYMTWFMATEYPERFAAIAPVAGGGDPEMGCRLTSVPAWIFHGALDTAVPFKEAEQMVNSIEACGGSVRLTVYPDAGHVIWDTTYNDPELYVWFIKNLIFTVDFNADGIVDSTDMCIMIDHWGTDYPFCDIGPMAWGDGIVDVQDLIVLAEHLFEEVPLPIELVAYWKFDESESYIAYDSAGDNHSTLSGNPTWQPNSGQVAGALEFDGIDDYISTDFVLDPWGGAFSVFAWIKGGAPGQVIISQADGNGSGETWLGMDALGGNLMTGLVPVTRAVKKPLVSESIITDDQWHHIGFVWDGSYRILYVDGIEVVKDTAAQNQLKSADGGLYIGTSKDLDASSFLSGLIDDVRIYDETLIAEKIEAMSH